MTYSHGELKDRQRAEREHYPENIGLRIHRALSWLDRAERCEDHDARFIFLWIAFNAAYANDPNNSREFTQKDIFENFIHRIIKLDKENVFYELIWSEFPKSIRNILDNKYIFSPFWDYMNGKIEEEQWKDEFARARAAVNHSLARNDTQKILHIIFSRLYTLRNQLVHGGATWNSFANREQLRGCTMLMSKLTPQIIKILMDHPDDVWGEPFYPFVE